MWESLSDDTRALVVQKGQGYPPDSMTSLLEDPEWSYLLGDYLSQNNADAHQFWQFATQDPDEAAKASGDGESEEYGAANFARGRAMAVEQLEPWLAPFVDEVQRIQGWAGTMSRDDQRWQVDDDAGREQSDPAPVMQLTDPSTLDTDYIQRVNEYSWESAKAAGRTEFMYLADPPLLLIGLENFTPNYRDTMRNAGARRGTISVDSRGGTFSRGGVTVSGTNDQAGFKALFRSVSDKSIKFS